MPAHSSPTTNPARADGAEGALLALVEACIWFNSMMGYDGQPYVDDVFERTFNEKRLAAQQLMEAATPTPAPREAEVRAEFDALARASSNLMRGASDVGKRAFIWPPDAKAWDAELEKAAHLVGRLSPREQYLLTMQVLPVGPGDAVLRSLGKAQPQGFPKPTALPKKLSTVRYPCGFSVTFERTDKDNGEGDDE